MLLLNLAHVVSIAAGPLVQLKMLLFLVKSLCPPHQPTHRRDALRRLLNRPMHDGR